MLCERIVTEYPDELINILLAGDITVALECLDVMVNKRRKQVRKRFIYQNRC